MGLMKKSLFMGELTKEQFNAEIQKGLDDIENGRYIRQTWLKQK